ncbi:hypothetical protein N7447_007760 [Penicillium robsamsonii]|uniref:uncharacterized protein n=1 Tax=Penicillium robsamsonii TaxID=1792511 RepID=UPI002547AB28|nr:uncharacterized protein N7447_007760 [Penicillium robsamsonii]KAJ5817752.1 hypothetical protein N7447_007760 [Penicillium robsamsonii]
MSSTLVVPVLDTGSLGDVHGVMEDRIHYLTHLTGQDIVVHLPEIETGGFGSERQQITPQNVDQRDPQADKAKLKMR